MVVLAVGLLASVVEAVGRVAPAVLTGIGALVLLTVVLGAYSVVRIQRRKRLRIRTLGELLALTPAQFEQAIAGLLHDTGYRSVRRVGRAGDLAADIVCKDARGRSVVVQCKRYAPGTKIGSPDVQTFIGMVTVHHRADYGIFATTSEFSAPAIALAKRHGVRLLDGSQLSRMVTAVGDGHSSGDPQAELEPV